MYYFFILLGIFPCQNVFFQCVSVNLLKQTQTARTNQYSLLTIHAPGSSANQILGRFSSTRPVTGQDSSPVSALPITEKTLM